MIRPEARARAITWLSPRTEGYAQAIVLLFLNVPFLLAALSRYPQHLTWTSVAGAYAVMVFAGYYVLALYLVLTLAFLVTGTWRRIFLVASTTILTLTLYYFIVDGIVYQITKMHIDAFWLEYLFTTFEGIGISVAQVATALAVLVAIVALEILLLRVARRIWRRALLNAGLAAVCVICLVVTQVIHVAAYEANDRRFTWLTPQLPFYFPLTSHKNWLKFGNHFSMIGELAAEEPGNSGESFQYPIRAIGCAADLERPRKNVLVIMLESWRADAMNSTVTPNMDAFTSEASYFVNHFSSGNSTRSGVFPLFYGIHPTYWTAIKANNVRIHNPVLIDALEENGYALGIFADSHFKRHKIKDAVFRDIYVEESFKGATSDARDQDMTERMFDFMSKQHAANTPFFSYAFYKSTHYPYDYPADAAVFQPTRELSAIRANANDDPTPALNDYRNAVHYVDRLFGDLLARMRAAGMLENTIIVITGDHGETFNDTRDNSWMHGGNFTRFLTQVPLIIYEPSKATRRVNTVTSEVDIAPTILQEGLQCGWNTADYSNGVNLFGTLPERRPIIVASYVDRALILNNEVLVSGPMYVERYDLDGKKTPASTPDARMMRQAVEEMTRFYGGSRKVPSRVPANLR